MKRAKKCQVKCAQDISKVYMEEERLDILEQELKKVDEERLPHEVVSYKKSVAIVPSNKGRLLDRLEANKDKDK
jgi:hypothetical protein